MIALSSVSDNHAIKPGVVLLFVPYILTLAEVFMFHLTFYLACSFPSS